jgi:hypothetical protein
MKPVYYIIIVFVCTYAFISCKKSDEDPQPTPPAPESTRMTKIFLLDTTITAPFDTINRGYFTYDSQNRPIKNESFQTDASGANVSHYILRYDYNGSDTLASRSIQDYTGYTNGVPTEFSSDTTSYAFVNGKCTYDSSYGLNSLGNPFYTVFNYAYAAGNIINLVQRSHSSGNPTTLDRQVVYQTLNGDDISFQVDSSFTIPASNSGSRIENTVTYLSNPNPFAIFSNPIRRPYLLDDIGIGSERASTKKLFSLHHCKYDSWNGSNLNHNEWSAQYTYTFRSDGYPTEYRETFIDNAVPKTYKSILIY